MSGCAEPCGITLYYDRRHKKLEEPKHFESHGEAAKWLNRSYTFVYLMVKNGEAVEDKHSFRTITPYAQQCGRNSSTWVTEHYNECICDPDHIQQCVDMNRTRPCRVTKPDGTVMIFSSGLECSQVIGMSPESVWYHCRTGTKIYQNSKYHNWIFEYI